MTRVRHLRVPRPGIRLPLLASLLLCACLPSVPSGNRPNIVLFVVDTLRADSLEPYGHPFVATPAVTQLADEGVLYEQAYAHSSWTRPSIASILTGLTPDVHRVRTRDDRAPEGLVLLSEALRLEGYRTGAIVTNPNTGAFFGFDQGYDDFLELFAHTPEHGAAPGDWRARARRVTREAIAWIDARDGRPFFLFLLTTDPHAPYEPSRKFDRYRNAAGSEALGLYLGEVAATDHAFGQLAVHLRESGLIDQTVIVFTSDHGEAFGEHRAWGHGNTLFDESVRVPLLIRQPGETVPGHRVTRPVQLVDLYPTLLRLAGAPVPEGLEGRDLLLRPHGASAPIYAQLELDGRSGEMLLAAPWKLIRSNGSIPPGLFALDVDAQERHDQAGVQADLGASLGRQLDERRVRSERDALRRLGPPSARSAEELPDELLDALDALGYIEKDPDGGS